MDTYEKITYSLYTNTKDLSYKNGIANIVTLYPPQLSYHIKPLGNDSRYLLKNEISRNVSNCKS